MKIHERETIVRQAEADLREKMIDFMKAYADKLTVFEYLRVVHGVLSDDIGSQIKYAIRQERHGNTDTPGGLAG